MKEENSNFPIDEQRKLSIVVEKAKRILHTKQPPKEDLSLGTLEYLRKYKIDT